MSKNHVTAHPMQKHTARRFVLMLGAILLLYLFNQRMDALWWKKATQEWPRELHNLHGIMEPFFAAIVSIWFILKTSPSFLVISPLLKGSRQSPLSPIVRHASWFIQMRWIAIILASLLLCFMHRFTLILPPSAYVHLILILGILVGCNLFFAWWVYCDKYRRFMLRTQIYVDFLALTGLLHWAGGIENPFVMLMLLHVIIGGILLSRPHCYQVTAVSSLLFAFLAWAEATGVWQHHPLSLLGTSPNSELMRHAALMPIYVLGRIGVQTGISFLTAYFVTTLMQHLRHHHRTLEQQADQAYRQQQLLEQSLENTNTGLRVLNQQYKPVWVSPQWRVWFDQSLAATPTQMGPLDRVLMAAKKTFQEARLHRTEICLAHPVPKPSEDASSNPGFSAAASPAPRFFEITTAPLFDRYHHIRQVVQLANETTQQKQLHTRMMRAGQLAAVGELAGQVAHEINNPIGIISAKIRLLLFDPQQQMSEKVKRELNKTIGLCDRIARITQGLLSSYRPSVSTLSVLDLKIPLDRAIDLIQQRAETAGIEICNQIPAGPILVRANISEMEQIFLNLFLNAIDAMPGGGTLTLASERTLDPQKEKEYVTVFVSDTGQGMTPEVQQHLFEAFYTTKQDGQGTGLGLSICHGLIRSQNGTIRMHSKLGQGTCFEITLPLATRNT